MKSCKQITSGEIDERIRTDFCKQALLRDELLPKLIRGEMRVNND